MLIVYTKAVRTKKQVEPRRFLCFVLIDRIGLLGRGLFYFGGIMMIKVTLKGDVVKEFPEGITAYEVAK